MKACFKLQHCLSSTNPSVETLLHLYDHTIKPILIYGSEIWGMFSVDSSSCRKTSDYCLEKIFSNGHTEQSHMKFLKYILGVNRKTANIAVMSELGRYPIYFSVILAMLKFCHRLESFQEGLLYDAYICNKDLHFSKISTWYSSILYIMDKLKINSLNLKLGQLCKQVKNIMFKSFLNFWHSVKLNATSSNRGKLNTYFYLKSHFGKEKYLEINNFKTRQSICKIRISAHSLNIETGRYKNIERSERKCTNCFMGDVEDEQHFIMNCPLYENIRKIFFHKIINVCPNFRYMDTKSKFFWIFTNEDKQILKELGSFIDECFSLRKN